MHTRTQKEAGHKSSLFLFADSAAMSSNIHINSPNVKYTDTHITAQYSYQTASVHREGNNITVRGHFLHFYVRTCIWMCHMYSHFALHVETGDPPRHRDDVPHQEARTPAGCDAGGLGRQQRDHGHSSCTGQQAGSHLENQDRAEGEWSDTNVPVHVQTWNQLLGYVHVSTSVGKKNDLEFDAFEILQAEFHTVLKMNAS